MIYHSKPMIYKRYEYLAREGKKFTPWFKYDGPQEKWQLKYKLLNEYKEC